MYIKRNIIIIDEKLFKTDKNAFDILLFFVKAIFLRTYIFLALLFSISLIGLSLIRDVLSLRSCILVFLIAFVIVISVVLEEFFHTVYFIYTKKSNLINSLAFDCLGLDEKKYLIFGIRVIFKGEITSNDMFYTSIAGPLLTIVYQLASWMFIFLIALIFQFDISIFDNSHLQLIFISSMLLPLLSLLPIKILTLESDGWKILNMVVKHKITLKDFICCLMEILKMSIYIFKKGLSFE